MDVLPRVREIANQPSDTPGAFTIMVPVACNTGEEAEIIGRMAPRERALAIIGQMTDGSYLARMRRLYVVTLSLLLEMPNESWTFTRIMTTLGIDHRTTVDVLYGLLQMGNITEIRTNRQAGGTTRVENATYAAVKDTLSFGTIKWELLDLGPYLKADNSAIEKLLKLRRLGTEVEEHKIVTKNSAVNEHMGQRRVGKHDTQPQNEALFMNFTTEDIEA